MAFEDKCIDEYDDAFMDSLRKNDNLIEKINHLKIHLEEAKLV